MSYRFTDKTVISDENRKFFPQRVFNAPTEGISLEICMGAGSQKKLDGAMGQNKKFHDIFSRVHTIHQRDRQTDGRTPGDSKENAYAYLGAVKIDQKCNTRNYK